MTGKLKYILLFFMLCFQKAKAQFTSVTDSSTPGFRTVIAGREYMAGRSKTFWLGKDWRKVWNTPILVQVLNPDSLFGGLTPIEQGGGRQTKTLHVRGGNGKRYVIRSVNKTYTLALPEIARGTIIEKMMNDQIASNHPFASLAVPPMANASGVYHTNPQLYFVPFSSRLGAFNNTFANMLVMVEERPDKSHAGAPNFGYPKDIDGSEDMIDRITTDNHVKVDQHNFLKTRLFDMFLGDWGRHIDNWRWAYKDDGKQYYQPVPKDRDQTWAKFEGALISLGRMIGALKQLQSFDKTIKNIQWFNYPAHDLDRRFTNELEKQEWIDSAKALQKYLTDSVIEQGINQMPPEIVQLTGPEISKNLKSRRNDLVKYAAEYYHYLSKKVDIPGTRKSDYFTIERTSDDLTDIRIYALDSQGKKEREPFYTRRFINSETDEVRLYGIDGNDHYFLSGNTSQGIVIRIIAGPGSDSLTDHSLVAGSTHKTKFYDNPGTYIETLAETKIRLADTVFRYPFEEDFQFDRKGLTLIPGLDPFYKIFVGLGYKIKTFGWREQPYKSELRIGLNYSISENSFHPYFKGSHPQLFGAWNLAYTIGYDQSRRLHFFGIGNETIKSSENKKDYFLRTENYYASAGLNNWLSTHHNIGISLAYDAVRLRSTSGTIAREKAGAFPDDFDWQQFGTVSINYLFQALNDKIVPTRGFQFNTSASHTFNFEKQSFNRYIANATLYLPLFHPFSIMINSGASTLSGDAKFYQLNNIGGNLSLRGYLRNRFYGKTTFYEQNEFRYIPDFKSFLFNGKVGLIALYDIGRVWQPGENSGTWHYGYGGGLLLAPFTKFSATIYYSISPEDKLFNFRLGKFF